ncbi:unnamed protein product [Pylaiella littoralis]
MQNPGLADSGNRCSAFHRGGQACDFRHTRPRTGKKNFTGYEPGRDLGVILGRLSESSRKTT